MQTDIQVNDRTRVSWVTTIALIVFHVLTVVALFNATWGAVLLAFALHWICIGWGIGCSKLSLVSILKVREVFRSSASTVLIPCKLAVFGGVL